MKTPLRFARIVKDQPLFCPYFNRQYLRRCAGCIDPSMIERGSNRINQTVSPKRKFLRLPSLRGLKESRRDSRAIEGGHYQGTPLIRFAAGPKDIGVWVLADDGVGHGPPSSPPSRDKVRRERDLDNASPDDEVPDPWCSPIGRRQRSAYNL